jgi:putative ABC transport system ATP-binding protein
MDEPSAALDPRTAGTIMELAARISREHELTTVFVTHSLREVEKYSSKVVLMQEGVVHKIWQQQEHDFVTAEELLKYF